jgi:outer membrane protein TolC
MKIQLKIALVLCLISNTFFGQQKLTFDQCIELAYANNLTLKKAELSVTISRAELLFNKGRLMPAVYGVIDNKNSWGREIDPVSNDYVDTDFKYYSGIIESTFNLFSGFSVWNSIKSSRQEVAITKMNIEKSKNALTIDLAQKYITILYLKETILANKEQIKESEKLMELAQLKFNSGAIAENELFKIKSQKATEELAFTTNSNQLEMNLIDIKLLMNMDLKTEIDIEKPSFLIPRNEALEENQYEVTNNAVQINPTFLISQYQVKKAKSELAIARSFRLPTLNLRFRYGSNYSDIEEIIDFRDQVSANLAYNLRVIMTIPLFSQFSTLSKVRQSKSLFKQAKLETKVKENEVSKEVLLAINNTKTAKKRVETLDIARDFNSKSYDGDLLKYELGKININELNITKSNFITTQIQYIKAKHELLFFNALIKFYLGEKFVLQ